MYCRTRTDKHYFDNLTIIGYMYEHVYLCPTCGRDEQAKWYWAHPYKTSPHLERKLCYEEVTNDDVLGLVSPRIYKNFLNK